MRLDWDDWLMERVTWRNVVELPRWQMIRNFVKKGIVPFFQKKGYVFYGSADDLCNKFASGLYINEGLHHISSDWKFGVRNDEYSLEEFYHYHDTFDEESWEDFWVIWKEWSDLADDDFRGIDRRWDIQDYCWTQVDLSRSQESVRFLENWGGGGSYNEDYEAVVAGIGATNNFSNKTDVYVKESIDSGQFDGYRK
jgi:hypothetical protein